MPEMQADLLPPCVFPQPYQCTVAELHERFVKQAPFPEQRELLFDALRIYNTLVWRFFPQARLWINGGFVTHKRWAAPGDIDVAIIIRLEDYTALPEEAKAELNQLLTLQDVSASSPDFAHLRRLQPMGGMIDGFIGVDTGDPGHQPSLRAWFEQWSGVTDEHKQPRHGVRKGFVEVVNPNA